MKRSTVVTLITGLVIGAAGDALLQDRIREKSIRATIRSLALTHAVDSAGLCANTLRAMDSKRPVLATKILETRLASAIRRAQSLTSEGATLQGHTPNLVEGFRRGGEYLRTSARDDGTALAASVEVVLDRMSVPIASPTPRYRGDSTGSDSSR